MELSQPDLPENDQFHRLSNAEPSANREFYRVRIDGVDWSDKSSLNLSFEASIIDHATLTRTQFRQAKFLDAVVRGSNVANADWTGGSLQRVSIISSRLTGFNGSEAQFRHVTFQRCSAQLAVFHSASFDRCRFEACDLSDATFEGASLTNVAFRSCNLTNARFVGGTIDAVDLRGSDIAGMQIAMASLKGVTIDPIQTTAIALLTGVKITADELPDQ